jgi:diguanylate cyclase (GGDEF)-like protein
MVERILRSLQNATVVVTQTGQTVASPSQIGDKTEVLATTNLPLMVPVPTVSIGLASFPEDARNPEMLIAKADAALYQAKRAGRNRIFASGEPLPHKEASREDTTQDERRQQG